MRATFTTAVALIALVFAGCSTAAKPPVKAAPDLSAPTAAPVAASSAPVELGPTPADEAIQFTVSLHLPGEVEMNAYLAGLTQPGSASYRQYLSPAQFGE